MMMMMMMMTIIIIIIIIRYCVLALMQVWISLPHSH